MTRNLRAALPLLLLLAAGGEAADSEPDALPQVASGRIERLPGFESQQVPPRNIDIWLPAGYPEAAPYAVLYMHDGQMLFDASQAWNKQEWRADEVAGELIAGGQTRPFIIVGIWNAGAARADEYFPQRPLDALRADDRDALLATTFGEGQRLFSGAVYSDRYLRFLVQELKPRIDASYATSPRREDTVVIGSSLGGLISMYALAEYPDVFGAAACLSTHWPGRLGDSPDNPVPAAFFDYIRARFPPAGTHRVYFDHGTLTLDASYADRQQVVDALLRDKGYRDTDFMSREFAGAEHNEQAWAARLAIPLRFVLAPARVAGAESPVTETATPTATDE